MITVVGVQFLSSRSIRKADDLVWQKSRFTFDHFKPAFVRITLTDLSDKLENDGDCIRISATWEKKWNISNIRQAKRDVLRSSEASIS